MTEFELGGNQYRIDKLDAFKQLHISRRIAPVIPTLIPMFVQLSKEGGGLSDLDMMAKLLEPFTESIAKMSDEDAEYVLGNCLSAVQRQAGKNWTSVWNKQADACMFDDIDLGTMMQLTMRVIQESLGPFIQGLLMSQQSSPTAA